MLPTEPKKNGEVAKASKRSYLLKNIKATFPRQAMWFVYLYY